MVYIDSIGTVTFGEAFSVDGFTQNGTVWTRDGYTFDESTGILSVSR